MFVRRLAALAHSFRRNQRGATAVEYGLIVALLALGMLAGLKGLASASTSLWNSNAKKVIEASN